MGIDPNTHKPRTDINHLLNLSQLLSAAQFSNPMSIIPWESNDQLAQIQLLQNLLQLMNPSTSLLSSGPQNPNLLNMIASSISTSHEGLLNNPISVTPQAVPNESQFDIGEYFEGGSGLNDLETNHKSFGSTSFDVKAENNRIPALVEASPVENKSSSTPTSHLSAAASPADNDFFDGWEKFLDDGDVTNDSYWREILEPVLPMLVDLCKLKALKWRCLDSIPIPRPYLFVSASGMNQSEGTINNPSENPISSTIPGNICSHSIEVFTHTGIQKDPCKRNYQGKVNH
ncbi:hypothetical protein HS088_TW15G00535 [Tripterygium wilfordii]|uniref:Uncharacterized protein n=1 Tax=Tripterygium wilfordii TaxID=458696 RepID=A0A7J7CM64_TRIWF|nr:hypothetical protein HS088_TW15G00535 [Tripterygium wilfordii]